MKEKIASVLNSKITDDEKTEKLYQIFKDETIEYVVCVMRGIIDVGEIDIEELAKKLKG